MKRAEIEKIVAEDLKTIGFIKKKNHFIKQLNKSMIGTIGFMISSFRIDHVSIVHPVVGVFYKPLEEIFCQLTGYDSIKNYQGTISTPIMHFDLFSIKQTVQS